MADGVPPSAVRVRVAGHVQGVGFRDAARRRALELGVSGWVRNEDDGTLALHVEDNECATAVLRSHGFRLLDQTDISR